MNREAPVVRTATHRERAWAAGVMAASDPWLRLGVSLQRCRAVCLNPRLRVLVARVGGKPAGIIVLHATGLAGSPYIRALVVEESFRGSGVGAVLVRAAEELFCGKAKHMFLCVSSFNRRAQAFYRRLGYRKVGELPDYVVPGASEFLLHKRLSLK